MNPAPQTRMGADERRDLVLEAATRAFARSGYAGTSTDAVAKEAGVSQPYVVRIRVAARSNTSRKRSSLVPKMRTT